VEGLRGTLEDRENDAMDGFKKLLLHLQLAVMEGRGVNL
jgi:hypothetical protein